ncbi:MAG: cytochrome c oxidase subunit II [Alphaproteobacteria bacterium]|nr:cytochrome c oxidase subunit II [Alphaproteobacteria bacterium]
MHHWVPFWPRTAAINGYAVDILYIAELALCGFILATVVALMFGFCVRYRAGNAVSRANLKEKTWHWEIGWTTISLIIFLVLFVEGAAIYIWLYDSPPGDLEVYVVGKQWMWKMQHPGGQREIDAMHVPVDKTVRLVLASQDVVHSFFVPAFRIKHDVVPGQYETVWFKATEPGAYAIECSEFCGTEHAHMKGEVVVMEPAAYARWLREQGVHESLAQQGQALFREHGCSGCHDSANSTVHAPSLVGVYGSLVHLQDGSTRRADDQYLRDCILLPRTLTVAGYPPIMPNFSGQLGEDDLVKLVAYIKSLTR